VIGAAAETADAVERFAWSEWRSDHEESSMYRNILVPIDGSAMATQGLHEAVQLAKQLDGRIRLIHVLNQTPWTAQSFAPVGIADLTTELRRAGESILERGSREVASAGVEVEKRLVEVVGERVGELVVAEANAWPADLIVCGTHGRRGVRRLLMGSDAEYIVRLSPVPVLLVRAPELASGAA
jgi:nucleotide-binding universal stress UspA family protein